MEETTYTISAMTDIVKEYLLSQPNYVTIIEQLGALGRGVFPFNPIGVPEKIQDVFLYDTPSFPMLLKRVICELVAGWKNDDKAKNLMNHLSIQITNSNKIKLNEWNSQYEGIPVEVECQVIAAYKKETYTKYAEAKCHGCGRTEEARSLSRLPLCGNKDCEYYKKEMWIDEKKTKTGDIKTILIEEPIEESKSSSPEILECQIRDQDVSNTFTGNKKRIIGILRSQPQKNKSTNKILIHALSVSDLEDTKAVLPNPEQETKFISMSKKEDYLDILSSSWAPEIKFEDLAKICMILAVVGGVKVDTLKGIINTFLVGDPGCVTGDTRIALSDGQLVRIETLSKNHLDELKIKILTGNQRTKSALTTKFHKYENYPTLEIITESGKRIRTTYNHPLLKLINKKHAWVRADELKTNDKIKITVSIPNKNQIEPPLNFKKLQHKYGPQFKGRLPERLTFDLAAIMGYVTGDGWVRKKAIGFIVSEDEIDLLPKLLQKFNDVFGVKPFIYTKINKDGKIGNRIIQRTKRMTLVEYFSNTLVSNLEFLKNKRVPDCIFKSTNKSTSEFLKWLFEADGTVFGVKRGSGAIQLKSRSPNLLQDVQLLLQRFGIHSRINVDNLTIRRGKDILKFAKHVGFASNKKITRLENLLTTAKQRGRVNNQPNEKIIKIIKHQNETVYDIEVPKIHQFIANGIISHNTGKSKILEFLLKVVQRSALAVGGTMSGSGVTVTMDTLPNRTKLPRAGIVPLCHGSAVALDELSQLEEEDIGKLYEAMASGLIHYNKGGFDEVFKAETTITAGANPKGYNYDSSLGMLANIGLPEPLITRFDLIVNMMGSKSLSQRETIRDHIKFIRRFGISEIIKKNGLLTSDELMVLLNYAKTFYPVFTDEAEKIIDDFHTTMEELQATNQQEQGAKRADNRTFEALYRIATAVAKLYFSNLVSAHHAEIAVDIYKRTLHSFGLKTDKGVTQLNINDAVKDKQTAAVFTWRKVEQETGETLIDGVVFIKRLMLDHPTYYPTIEDADKWFENQRRKGKIIMKGLRYKYVD